MAAACGKTRTLEGKRTKLPALEWFDGDEAILVAIVKQPLFACILLKSELIVKPCLNPAICNAAIDFDMSFVRKRFS